VRKTTLRYQLDHLKKTGRFDQYKLKWHPAYDFQNGLPALFWDSDVGKWIEAACYFLMDGEDEGIEDAVNEIVEDIRGAQQEDGYLNVHYQVRHQMFVLCSIQHIPGIKHSCSSSYNDS